MYIKNVTNITKCDQNRDIILKHMGTHMTPSHFLKALQVSIEQQAHIAHHTELFWMFGKFCCKICHKLNENIFCIFKVGLNDLVKSKFKLLAH